ncbi:hypothetical protein FEZ48_05345 [Marinilactibacillus psychrotolerans]|uniref:LURP-one-related family protein n=1 Tax=Marinilactibacillus psychrotolerans TaxID=191770 RepID=A0A5R9C4V0_9LACT|nr:LURP-one-related family protein [Marinilactibacillus psychrotolerans]TLQ07937.1 hypothetical protein FEZ48_05345 [Marinilactibacillus psychrotolerans]
MKYYIKQKVFSFKDQFVVKNEAEQDAYYVEGKLFTLGSKLHIFNTDDEEVLYVEQKVWRFLPEFEIYQKGKLVATVKKEFRFFKNDYSIIGPDWNIEGSVMAHNYVIKEREKVVAEISKEWLSWGDSYVIDIQNNDQRELLLGVVIVIDCVISANRNQGASS